MTTDLALGVLLGISVAVTLARAYSDMGGDASIDTRGRAWLRRFLHFLHHGDVGLGIVFLCSVFWHLGIWVPPPFFLGLFVGFGTGAAVEDGLYHAIKKFRCRYKVVDNDITVNDESAYPFGGRPVTAQLAMAKGAAPSDDNYIASGMGEGHGSALRGVKKED